MRGFWLWFLVAAVAVVAAYFGVVMLVAGAAWAGDQLSAAAGQSSEGGLPYQQVAVICEAARDDKTELVAMGFHHGERAQEACPPGSVYAGFEIGVEIVSGEPAAKSMDQTHANEGRK